MSFAQMSRVSKIKTREFGSKGFRPLDSYVPQINKGMEAINYTLNSNSVETKITIVHQDAIKDKKYEKFFRSLTDTCIDVGGSIKRNPYVLTHLIHGLRVSDMEDAIEHLMTPKLDKELRVSIVMYDTIKKQNICCGFGIIETTGSSIIDTSKDGVHVHPQWACVHRDHHRKKYCKIMMALLTSVAFRFMNMEFYRVYLWIQRHDYILYNFTDASDLMKRYLDGFETFKECPVMFASIPAMKFNEVAKKMCPAPPRLVRQNAISPPVASAAVVVSQGGDGGFAVDPVNVVPPREAAKEVIVIDDDDDNQNVSSAAAGAGAAAMPVAAGVDDVIVVSDSDGA